MNSATYTCLHFQLSSSESFHLILISSSHPVHCECKIARFQRNSQHDCLTVTAEKQMSVYFLMRDMIKREQIRCMKSKSCVEVELSYVDLCVKVKQHYSHLSRKHISNPQAAENSTAECWNEGPAHLIPSQHSHFPFQFQNGPDHPESALHQQKVLLTAPQGLISHLDQ